MVNPRTRFVVKAHTRPLQKALEKVSWETRNPGLEKMGSPLAILKDIRKNTEFAMFRTSVFVVVV